MNTNPHLYFTKYDPETSNALPTQRPAAHSPPSTHTTQTSNQRPSPPSSPFQPPKKHRSKEIKPEKKNGTHSHIHKQRRGEEHVDRNDEMEEATGEEMEEQQSARSREIQRIKANNLKAKFLRCCTNPHCFEIDNIRFLGTSGQNVDDLEKYSGQKISLNLWKGQCDGGIWHPQHLILLGAILILIGILSSLRVVLMCTLLAIRINMRLVW